MNCYVDLRCRFGHKLEAILNRHFRLKTSDAILASPFYQGVGDHGYKIVG